MDHKPKSEAAVVYEGPSRRLLLYLYAYLIFTTVLLAASILQYYQVNRLLNELQDESSFSLHQHKSSEREIIGLTRATRQFRNQFRFGNFGTAAVYWNSKSCLSEALMYYTGNVGAVVMENASFGGGNKLECIPDTVKSEEAQGNFTLSPQLRLAEINLLGMAPTGNPHWRTADGKKMPCSKCILPSSDVTTSFGKTSCRDGYGIVYRGYAMTSWQGGQGSASSEMICVRDRKDESITATNSTSSNSPQLTFVVDGASTGQVVQCVVCRKTGNRPSISARRGNRKRPN